jgi:hypothetical protein
LRSRSRVAEDVDLAAKVEEDDKEGLVMGLPLIIEASDRRLARRDEEDRVPAPDLSLVEECGVLE